MNTEGYVESASLYTKGRTIKAHIDRANKHKDRYHQHARSAGLLLIEAKAEVQHGQWENWLKEHGIKSRTARLLMQEHRDPAATIRRQEANNERGREARESNRQRVADSPAPPKPEPTAPRQEKATVHRLAHSRLKARIDLLTEEQVMELQRIIDDMLLRKS